PRRRVDVEMAKLVVQRFRHVPVFFDPAVGNVARIVQRGWIAGNGHQALRRAARREFDRGILRVGDSHSVDGEGVSEDLAREGTYGDAPYAGFVPGHRDGVRRPLAVQRDRICIGRAQPEGDVSIRLDIGRGRRGGTARLRGLRRADRGQRQGKKSKRDSHGVDALTSLTYSQDWLTYSGSGCTNEQL